MAYGSKTTKTFAVSSSSIGWYYDIVLSYQQDNDEGLTKVTIEYGQLRKVGYPYDYNRGTVNVGVKLNGVEFLTNNIANNDAGQTLTKHMINKSVVYTCDDEGNTTSVAIQCKVTFSVASAFNPSKSSYGNVGTLTIPKMDERGNIYKKISGQWYKGQYYEKISGQWYKCKIEEKLSGAWN